MLCDFSEQIPVIHELHPPTVGVWTRGGLVTYYLLFVMELATRRVHLANS